MTDQQPDPMGDWVRQVNAAFEPLRSALQEAVATLARGFARWAETPEGQQVLEYARYLNERPELLEQLRAERQSCHCLCQRWGHLGACTGEATTSRMVRGLGYPHEVPLCAPCAASIDGQR